LLCLLWHQAGDVNAAEWWATAGLILFAAGRRFEIRDARVQGMIIAALSFATALWLDIDPPRLAVSLTTVAALYGCQYFARPQEEARANVYFSALATLLLCAVLYGRVSGSLLTVSLGFEGLALLAAGFPLRERVLRLEGLGLLLFCILKLFVYDLRNLETLYRILSFIALGLILLAVSWIYTRFREHIRRLL